MELYRGIRENSRIAGATWWTAQREYANQYGKNIITRNVETDGILEIPMMDLYTTDDLDAILPGFGEAFGLDDTSPSIVDFETLWQAGDADEWNTIQAMLIGAGYTGMHWIEEQTFDAFLLW